MNGEKITRENYMAGKVTHQEFHSAVAHAAGIDFSTADILPRVRAAIAKGDEHLNSIPLRVWDMLALSAKPAITRALKAHGDFWSDAGGVCVVKQAAREAAQTRAAEKAQPLCGGEFLPGEGPE